MWKTLNKDVNCSLCLCHWGYTPSLVIIIIIYFILCLWWFFSYSIWLSRKGSFFKLDSDCASYFLHHFLCYNKTVYSIRKLNMYSFVINATLWLKRKNIESCYMECHTFTKTIKIPLLIIEFCRWCCNFKELSAILITGESPAHRIMPGTL